jgi:DNA-binding HxlR family transcriptional regulator
MNREEQKVPVEQLPAAIEELLKRGPRSFDQIARAVGWSQSSVRKRVEELALAGRVHRRRVRVDCPGFSYNWFYGPAPEAAALPHCAMAQEPQRADLRAKVPFQNSVRTWPAIDRRDPLVAALFGPAPAQRSVTP